MPHYARSASLVQESQNDSADPVLLPWIWWSITAFIGLQVVYRLVMFQFRAAAGLGGVWLLLLACRIMWRKGWKMSAMVLLLLAMLLGDFCAVLLVMDSNN